MLRKLLLWSHRNGLSQKTQFSARRRRAARTLRDTSLGMECLELRAMLSATPTLFIEANQFFGANTGAPGFFRATFTDALQAAGEDVEYEYSIDWDNDGNYDVTDLTFNFQIQTPFGQQESAGDQIVGRFDVAAIDENLTSVFTSPGQKTIKVKLNELEPVPVDVWVYTVDEDLFFGETFEGTAVEGENIMLTLPTHLPNDTPIESWRINWGDVIETTDDFIVQATHTYSDDTDISFSPPSEYNITAVAFAVGGGAFYANGPVFVEIQDDPADTTISGPNGSNPFAVNEGEDFTLNLSCVDVADDSVQGWQIFWKGLTSPVPTVEELAALETVIGNPSGVTHVYGEEDGGKSYDIVAIAFSDDGNPRACNNVLTVTVNEAAQDGVFLVEGTLSVIDTNAANDIVTVTQSGEFISVTSNSNTTDFNISDVDEIAVALGSGHDVVVIGSNITLDVMINGGDGNDFLAGGGGRSVLIGGNGNDILWGAPGDDVLLGGDGDDDLFGGGGNDALVGGLGNDIVTGDLGRDLVIGGENQDALVGGIGEDILIGGTTIHDDDIAALDNIMAIWGSADSFNSRVATLTATGGLLEADIAVFVDDAVDILIGTAGGRDLVFGDTNPAGDGVTDSLMLTAIQDRLVSLS